MREALFVFFVFFCAPVCCAQISVDNNSVNEAFLSVESKDWRVVDNSLENLTICSSSSLVINELMYRPSISNGMTYNAGEMIELLGPPGMNISCHVLTDGDWTITIPTGTIIPPDGIFTIGNDSVYGAGTFDLDAESCGCFTDGSGGSGLMIFIDGGEYLALFDSSGIFSQGLVYGAPSSNNLPPLGSNSYNGIIHTVATSGCPDSVIIPSLSFETALGIPLSLGTSIIRSPDGVGTWASQAGGSINFCNVGITNPTNERVFVFYDLNSDCVNDAGEFGINGIGVEIQPLGIIGSTDSVGLIKIDSLPDGSYTAVLDTSNLRWSSNCPTSMGFNVTNGLSDTILCFGLSSSFPCAEPNVSIAAPLLRRCFNNQKIYISVCNAATATAGLNNAFVDIELPMLLTPTSASLPDSALGNNVFRYFLGTINPNQCINFYINTTVSCNAQINQTLCIEANLYPVDSCVLNTSLAIGTGVSSCSLPWDNSSLQVDGWCNNDTVYFTIENTGDLVDGDMDCFSSIRVFNDGQLVEFDSIMLLGEEVDTFMFIGNGETWRLEADQHPLHPGNSHPNASVELCGDTTNWIPNLITILPQDDIDPVVDIFCGLVSGSYDPNDKTGYPLGVTDTNFISPNGKIDYLIRFQNTGTDTAFTVVIRDTLDVDLDVFSVVSGVSSHAYSFRLYGPRVLEWTFNNIMLPDSNINESGSKGFISFSVMQKENLLNGTQITNSAAIYFDFNAPIITNTSLHTINDIFNSASIVLGPTVKVKEAEEKRIVVYPNPNNGQFIVGFKQKFNNAIINIYDIQGRSIYRLTKFSGSQTSIDLKVPTGVYIITIQENGVNYRERVLIN